jgi:hypothetical protein
MFLFFLRSDKAKYPPDGAAQRITKIQVCAHCDDATRSKKPFVFLTSHRLT